MSNVSGSLITRNYANFRGVDFTDNEVSLTRSPDSLNMFKDYRKLGKCIETRPEVELVATYDNTIFGLFWYKVGNTEMQIVHSGTKLYKVVGDTKEELFTGMMPARSNAFVYNQILYIKDGINYLKYDGETISQVVGYIPTTSIGRKPAGGGTIYEDVNMLSAWRKNTFLGDGESTLYALDTGEIDGEAPIVSVQIGKKLTLLTPLVDYDYSVGTEDEAATILFKVAPPKPSTDGRDNVFVTFKKTVAGYADRINKCTLLAVFDNRVFFSGNQDYPNTVWHSSLNNPTYCSDLDFYNEGLDLSPVRSMVAGNNALWVFKEPSQANTTVFYHNPVVDAEYGKIYPSTHSSIATGCVGAGINFNDDIAFFSDRGMEAINGDVTTEQVIAHRSSMVDSRLLSEVNYKDMLLEEWEGYLLVIIDNKVYLADSRAMYQNENHMEYEWFYWELDKTITCTKVKDGVLYIGTADGIYKLGYDESEYTEVTFKEEEGGYAAYDLKAGKYITVLGGRQYRFILNTDANKVYLDEEGLKSDAELIYFVSPLSYWTTPEDEFNYPQYQKTTNKRGCVIDMEGNEVTVSARIDNKEFEVINTYTNVKGYVVSRIKKKKWKSIQLKFSSNTPFNLYSNTLEAYVGGYVKR